MHKFIKQQSRAQYKTESISIYLITNEIKYNILFLLPSLFCCFVVALRFSSYLLCGENIFARVQKFLYEKNDFSFEIWNIYSIL